MSDDAEISARTDAYFNRTRAIVARFGDKQVTYAIFLRRPVISAPRLMLDWLRAVARARGAEIATQVVHPEGSWVGAGEPIVYLTGSLHALSDLETILLQKLGPASVSRCAPPMHSVTSCPVISTCTPPAQLPSAA